MKEGANKKMNEWTMDYGKMKEWTNKLTNGRMNK